MTDLACVRAISHRLRARDHYTSSTLSDGKTGANPSSLHTTLEGPTKYICECKMDGTVYMDFYMASNGSCFMVIWTVSRNHLMEVGLTQNRETMALQTLTTVDLFYFIICEDMYEYKSIEIEFGWGPGFIWLHTSLEVPWSHYMILEVSWDKGLWTLFFWVVTISWSRLLARGWSGP